MIELWICGLCAVLSVWFMRMAYKDGDIVWVWLFGLNLVWDLGNLIWGLIK